MSFRNGAAVLAVANLVADGIPVRGAGGHQHLSPGPGREDVGRVVVALLPTVVDEATWVADRVAGLGAGATADAPVDWGKVAVLARKRSQFPRLEAALRERGVPVRGGRARRPAARARGGRRREHACGCSPTRPRERRCCGCWPGHGGGSARATSTRWAAGPGGSRWRAVPGRRPGATPTGSPPTPTTTRSTSAAWSTRSTTSGDPDGYSDEGFARLARLRDELRRLRRLSSSSLPDLVMAVVRSLDLDVELASRPGVRATDALLDVDRLVEVAEEFVASGEDPGLLAFLAYLDTAEERERGLEVEVAEPDGSRVQLMTVHAAKGLEWDVVVVAGLTKGVFPVDGQPVADWTRQVATLPFPLRGDRSELPVFRFEDTADQVAAHEALADFRGACKARGALEERRLAYVAVTRARDLLLCSGYWWDGTTKPRGPAGLLSDLAELCRDGGGTVDVWAPAPEDDDTNPLDVAPVAATWPFDPLGARRGDVSAAARLVRQAHGPPPPTPPEHAARVAAWDDELELLLAELDRHRRSRGPAAGVVELPSRLSVSQLVMLRRDPAELARSLRRPLPRRPAPLARRGTRFHLWLEARWGQQRLLDVDELPGAADETAQPDDDLVALQAAFDASEWAARVPAEVELPFDMVVDGLLLRGRCDAVFTDAPDGLVDVVDWKTGAPSSGVEADAAAVQLAVYRLAWHHLTGEPLANIRAAFHHVATGVTIRPADLLDEAALVGLVRSVPTA